MIGDPETKPWVQHQREKQAKRRTERQHDNAEARRARLRDVGVRLRHHGKVTLPKGPWK